MYGGVPVIPVKVIEIMSSINTPKNIFKYRLLNTFVLFLMMKKFT